jgi:hypothetical protein
MFSNIIVISRTFPASCLFKAGDQAGRMAADAEALEHYRRAEDAYMKVAARELTPLQRASLDRKLGQAFYGVGNYDLAVRHERDHACSMRLRPFAPSARQSR